jgi:hypothetical protein
MDMPAEMYYSPPPASLQPEEQSPLTAPDKKFETCLLCAFSNQVGQKCTCSACSNCGEASRGKNCKRCGTPKPFPLCRICQNKADESGLCTTCAARTGREACNETFCLVCFTMGCTVHQ